MTNKGRRNQTSALFHIAYVVNLSKTCFVYVLQHKRGFFGISFDNTKAMWQSKSSKLKKGPYFFLTAIFFKKCSTKLRESLNIFKPRYNVVCLNQMLWNQIFHLPTPSYSLKPYWQCIDYRHWICTAKNFKFRLQIIRK